MLFNNLIPREVIFHMNIANIMTIIGFVTVVLVLLILLILFIYLYVVDRTQKQHPVLRNYPVLGRTRYFLEKIGTELRQYCFNTDLEGKPFYRKDYQHIVKKAKYKRDVLGFGSEKNFEEPGYYVRNSMFPKLTEELQMNPKKVTTNRYLLLKDPLFTQREEQLERHESSSYMLEDKDAIVIGPKTRHP